MNSTFVGDCECVDDRINNNTKIWIQAEHTTRIHFTIDCNLSEVKEWYIKYGTLYITLKDGTEKEIEGATDTDYKYPVYVHIMDGDEDDEYETITV